MPFVTLGTSPSASTSSLAQLEALTRSKPQRLPTPPSQARHQASSPHAEPTGDLQVPKQCDGEGSKGSVSRASSWMTIGSVTPATSSCAYETEAWEGDDEMDDDDNGTEMAEEKTMEAQEADEIMVDDDTESHEDSESLRDTIVDAKVPGEAQLAPPVALTTSAQESTRRRTSAKAKSKIRARKSRQPWAWRCFLWCCVVERTRGHG